MKTPHLIIGHSYEVYTKGLRQSLAEQGYIINGVVREGELAQDIIFQLEPHIAILQENFENISAFDIVEKAISEKLRTKFVVIYPDFDPRAIILSQRAGVQGALYLGDAMLSHMDCILSVMQGKTYCSSSFFKERLDRSLLNLELLSLCERRVLRMIGVHDCSETIARRLNLSRRTIEKHRSNIIAKLKIDKKTNSLLQWVLKNRQYVESSVLCPT